MSISTQGRNKTVTELLNGTLLSMKAVVPFNCRTKKPQLLKHEFNLAFGVLIGITGDIKGKLVLSGSLDTFGSIGKTMSGISLADDMLLSFSGELGNMIAGGLSTNMSANGSRQESKV